MVKDTLTSAAIKHQAREIGFDLCGIAPAESFPELAFFREWIDRGYAGTMGYLPRSAERRSDVRRVVRLCGRRRLAIRQRRREAPHDARISARHTRVHEPGAGGR